MKLASFVSYITREKIREHGNKDILLKREIFFGIIPQAYMEMDRVSNKPLLTHQEYVNKVLVDADAPDMIKLIQHIHTNYNNKNYDNDLTLEEKRIILKNSIDVIRPTIQDLKDNHRYDEYAQNNSETKIADKIIENLVERKLPEDKETTKILKSLENIKMNFWVDNINGKRIYPIVSDLLEDVILLEFAFDTDKILIQKIIEVWKNADIAQKEREFFSYLQFTKMEFINEVKYHNGRRYLLAEYTRTLDLDEKKLQNFFQHMLYYNIANHKRTPGLGLDIDKIPPRPFLLERTKNIVGEWKPVPIPIQR